MDVYFIFEVILILFMLLLKFYLLGALSLGSYDTLTPSFLVFLKECSFWDQKIFQAYVIFLCLMLCISYFWKETWCHLLRTGIKNQYLGTECPHCYCNIIVPGSLNRHSWELHVSISTHDYTWIYSLSIYHLTFISS